MSSCVAEENERQAAAFRGAPCRAFDQPPPRFDRRRAPTPHPCPQRYTRRMDASAAEPRESALSPRVALLSIVLFWLFYFAIITIRSLVMYDDQFDMMLRRMIVVVTSVGITLLVYLVLRRVSIASFRRSVLTAALLAVPAAIAYSTVNYYAFKSHVDREMQERRVHMQRKLMITGGRGSHATVAVQVGADPFDDEEKSAVAQIADQAANGYFFFVTWCAVYLALCYAAQAVAAERRAARFRAAAQAAEIKALRYQVNPHFLFNTLNSLSALVLGDRRDEAERMLLNLAAFFRTSLTIETAEDLPLFEEISLQRLYLGIEQVRFPDRLIVDIDIPNALRTARVPGLILQPLVENAVKYGVSRARRPVTIRVRAREEKRRLVLSVEDNGDAAEPASGGTGFGLRNVRDRLAARFGEGAACRWGPAIGGGFAVTLYMPLTRDG